MEPAAHEDRDRRYTAAIANGSFYLVAGIFGTSITGMLNAFPAELVHIIAALALLPTIGNSLAVATTEPSHREAAMITFLVTLSGVTIAQIGAPFWGAVAAEHIPWFRRPDPPEPPHSGPPTPKPRTECSHHP